MERKIDMLKRVYVLFVAFVVVAIILFVRVVNINVVEGDRWRAEGDSLYSKYQTLDAERGNILSDDGSFLATSLQFFDVRVDLNSTAMREQDFDAHVDSLAICLAKHTHEGKTPLWMKNKLIKARKAGSRSFLVKKGATYKDLELIKTFPLLRLGRYRGGLVVEPYVKRYKPFKSLAARTIGESRANAKDLGIEKAFDEYLRGKVGKRLMQRVSGNVWLPVNELTEITPLRGADVHTTLNVDIQDVTSAALLEALETHKAEYGVAIVMEVKTGAVKAIANLERTANGDYRELDNHAVKRLIEPGSTIKLATMMALLEDGKIQPDDRVTVGYGRGRFCGREVKDSEPHAFDETTARHAFEISSNVGMARMVTKAYKQTDQEQLFIDRLRQFHVGQPTGIELHGEQAQEIKNAGDRDQYWSCLSLPWMSFGYELSMTPLQIAAFYNAVANDGRYMKPYLVDRVTKGAEEIRRFEPQIVKDQIASAQTIEHAKRLLEGVMLNGTGKKIKLPFATAGKTGTSQIDYAGGDKGMRYQSSFAGYFPADDPQYTCVVIVNKPSNGVYYGSRVAGPVFKDIALKCMNRIPEPLVAMEASDITWPVYDVGYRRDVQALFDEMGMTYDITAATEHAVIMPADQGLGLEVRSTDDDLPDVRRMTLKDALYVLENKGYEVQYTGFGRVKNQKVVKPPDGASSTVVLVLDS